jgi:predicted transposase YdaD
MTTVLDLLKEEGFQEGFQKGFQEGLQEAQDKDITRLLQHTSLSPREVATILEVDLSRVLNLAGALGDAPLSSPPDPGKNSHT